MKSCNSNVFCEICCSNEAKYRCPGCNTRTCSLGCVKAHKLDSSCDGRRCKTAYVSQSEFSDNHLLSDYRFLEEVGCYVDSINRDGVVRGCQKRRGLNLHRFKNACRKRNISFLYHESNMTKRLQNSTSYNGRRNMITWRVEWIFANADDAHFTDPRVCEDTPLKVLLEKYLHPTNADPIIRHRLQKYLSSGGVDNVEVYMKVQWKQLKGPRYHKMDVTRGLRENLSHKTVVEYPTLHVCIAQSPSTAHYIVYDRSVDNVFIVPKPLNTRINNEDDGGDYDNGVSVLYDSMRHEMEQKVQPFNDSVIDCVDTNPYPSTLGKHCDAEEETKDCVMLLSNGNTNGLQLLMGQYDDSDSELEPGELP